VAGLRVNAQGICYSIKANPHPCSLPEGGGFLG